MFTAQRASEDIEYRTPVESMNSQNIGVVAIGFMTTVLSGIVALDVLMHVPGFEGGEEQ